VCSREKAGRLHQQSFGLFLYPDKSNTASTFCVEGARRERSDMTRIIHWMAHRWKRFLERLDENTVNEPIDYGGDPTDIYLA
jgi:hypothetical protein